MRKQKGFSLVELLVSMAIIAVLLALVGYGISIAQRNSRDSQRRQKIADLQLALQDYQQKYNTFPADIDVHAVTSGTSITMTNSADVGGAVDENLNLSGPTKPSGTNKSDAGSTGYCYHNDTANGGYELGAALEAGDVVDGSSTTNISVNNCKPGGTPGWTQMNAS